MTLTCAGAYVAGTLVAGAYLSGTLVAGAYLTGTLVAGAYLTGTLVACTGRTSSRPSKRFADTRLICAGRQDQRDSCVSA